MLLESQHSKRNQLGARTSKGQCLLLTESIIEQFIREIGINRCRCQSRWCIFVGLIHDATNRPDLLVLAKISFNRLNSYTNHN